MPTEFLGLLLPQLWGSKPFQASTTLSEFVIQESIRELDVVEESLQDLLLALAKIQYNIGVRDDLLYLFLCLVTLSCTSRLGMKMFVIAFEVTLWQFPALI